MPRLVFVLLDGLAADTARRCLSFALALEEAGEARYCELEAELPSLSRPIYATLLSGLAPVRTGIVHNGDARLCPAPTIFQRARSAGLTTAAAAYHWISELCNRAPFVPARDRLIDDPRLPVSHGLFYGNDAYPDDELFGDAECLRLRHEPALLLVHPMGIDFAGHGFGADSPAYRQAARRADNLLARHVPRWLGEGYAVLVTSDHGMDNECGHSDAVAQNRRVPLWLMGRAWEDLPLPGAQTEVAGLVLRLLGIREQSGSKAARP